MVEIWNRAACGSSLGTWLHDKQQVWHKLYIIYIMGHSKQPEPRRADAGPRVKSMRHKAILAERFRHARHACWLTVPQTAKLLHVSVRTVHNWEAGTVRVPFTAYKLMRILRGVDLPNGCELLSNAWAGWRFQGDKLISPEGREFVGTDSAWWSLLVQRARLFSARNAKTQALTRQSQGAAATADNAAGAAAPAASQEPFTGLQAANGCGMVSVAGWQCSVGLPAASVGQPSGFWYQTDTRTGDFSPAEPVKRGGGGPSSNTGQKSSGQVVGAAQ